MGRKRRSNKHLPSYVYLVKRKMPYKLVLPQGGSKNFATLAELMPEWVIHYGGDEAAGGSLRLGALMDRYMAEVLPKKRERTQVDYRGHLAKLRPVFGDMDVRALRPTHVHKYLQLRGRQSVHQANREVAVLSGICKIAVLEGLIDRNPCRDVPRLTEYPRETDVVEQDFIAVFNRATPDVQIGMVMTRVTGIRRGDLLALMRSNFGDDGLRYVESKSQRTADRRGGKKRHWAWSPTLRWAYARSKEIQRRPTLYFLAERNGDPVKPGTFSKRFRAAVDKAIADGDLSAGFHFRDIRAMSANEADNPFELLSHADGSVTVRNYLNRRARTTRPVR